MQIPSRVDASSLMWFYEQHRALWTWISNLSYNDISKIITSNPEQAPDYAIKRAWPGWGDRWGLTYGSFACEVGGRSARRCFNCPLGADFCQLPNGGYQRFLASIRSGDLSSFKIAALEIRDAWVKPARDVPQKWW